MARFTDRYPRLSRLFVLTIVLVSIVPVGIYAYKRATAFGHESMLFSGKSNMLLRSAKGIYLLIDYINKYTPDNSLVLVFRQNDFALYGERKFVRHLDPRMLPVLQAEKEDDALRQLYALGIDYILIPAYGLVTIFDSKLYDLLSDPSVVELVMESGGGRLLRLLKPEEHRKISYREVEMGGGGLSVTRGGKAVNILYPDSMADIVTEPTGGRSYFYTGLGGVDRPPLSDIWKIQPGSLYRFTSRISGVGWLRLYLIEYLISGEKKISRIWESTMLGQERDIATLFISDKRAVKYRFVYEMTTRNPVQIESSRLYEVHGAIRTSGKLPDGEVWSTYDDHISYSVYDDATTFKVDSGFVRQCIHTGIGSKAVAHSRYGIDPDRYDIWSVFPQAFSIDIEGRGVGEFKANILFYSNNAATSSLTLLAGFMSGNEQFSLHKMLIVPPGIKEYRIEFCFNNKVDSRIDIRRDLMKMVKPVMRWPSNIEYSGRGELTIGKVKLKKLAKDDFSKMVDRCLSDYGVFDLSEIGIPILCFNPDR